MRYLSVLVLLVVFMSGCGWSDLPPSSSVTISALPAKSPIAPGETVVVTGTINGYSGDKLTSWSVQESYDAEQKMCRFYTGKAGSASFTECKYGYVVYEDVASSMHAIYYAPPTPGTYHITFGVFLIGSTGFTDTRFQSGTAVIEVKSGINDGCSMEILAMLRTTVTRYSILLLVAMVPVLFLTSCIIVPHPMTRRVVGMNGPIKGGIDFKFIVAGTTRADEVREKLKDVDTGFEHERLFWARWCDSHTGITGGVGGYGAAAGGTGRLWGVRNLFVRFDERGIVTSVREFKDGELYAVVTRWVKEADPPALDLSSPVSLMVRSHGWQHYNNVTILLSDGELSFTEDNKPARSFTVKPVQVRSLEGSWARENDIEPRLTSQTIHFSTNTVVGSKLTIDMSALDLMDFAIYLRDQRK